MDGADFYLTKPFSQLDLTCGLKGTAALIRCAALTGPTPRWKHGLRPVPSHGDFGRGFHVDH